MTTPMMAPMPTPNPAVVSSNGHHPNVVLNPNLGPAHPAAAPAPARRRLPDLHGSNLLGNVFYTVVLLIALAGGSTAAEGWLGWWFPLCVVIVAAVELGGVYLSVMADERRRLGEAAIAARIGSLLVAAGAVALNWYGHSHMIQAAVFAGFSGGGYAIWIIRTGQKRRDALRLTGMLAEQAPFYGPIQWICHPRLTRRARALAVETPSLGLHGSLRQAAADAATARRHKAIIALVRTDLTEVFGGPTAELAVTIADPDRLAAEIEARTDWKGMAAVFAGRLDPSRLATEARRKGRKASLVTARPTAAERAALEAAVRGPAAETARPPTATARAANRAAESARGGWWTTARADFYARVYAPTLDEQGVEVGGADLASGLGLDPGNARRARDQKLRDRYVQEVVNGARKPRSPLPDAIAQKVAERAQDHAQTARTAARSDDPGSARS